MAVRTASGAGLRPAGSRDPGRRVLAAVRRRPLGAFFLLAYLFSWGYWVPVAVAGGHLSHFPGLLGPMLAAFVVSAVVGGRAGIADLLRRMARWRLPVRWYAAALVPLAPAAVALAVASAFGGGLPSLDQLSRMPGLPAAGWVAVLALTVLVNGYGEETGWRGFAWPRLRERHGLAGAALLLTGPWALWHLPTFWLDTGLRGFAPVMIPGFLVGMAAGAVVLGWLYERSGGSVLVVALWHAALNMASATEGTEDVAAATTAVVIVWAVLILRAERRRAATAAGEGALAGPLGRLR
jgi:membrane protease YdiL (CAAX protease family)